MKFDLSQNSKKTAVHVNTCPKCGFTNEIILNERTYFNWYWSDDFDNAKKYFKKMTPAEIDLIENGTHPSCFPMENGLRLLAAVSRQHVLDFFELVHAHMGPAAEPQLLIYEDISAEERIFLSFTHLIPASTKQNRYINRMIDKGEM